MSSTDSPTAPANEHTSLPAEVPPIPEEARRLCSLVYSNVDMRDAINALGLTLAQAQSYLGAPYWPRLSEEIRESLEIKALDPEEIRSLVSVGVREAVMVRKQIMSDTDVDPQTRLRAVESILKTVGMDQLERRDVHIHIHREEERALYAQTMEEILDVEASEDQPAPKLDEGGPDSPAPVSGGAE